MTMEQRVKRSALRVAGWLAGPGPDRPARILGYHSVGDGQSVLSIPTEQFRWQLAWLVDYGHQFLTLRAWWELARQGRTPSSPSVVLTFDDGYRGVLRHAAPLLASYGIRATVFVVTDHVGGTNTYDRLRHAPQLPLLSWPEIRELCQLGWDVQSHGRRHMPMAGLRDDLLTEETMGSKLLLEQALGTGVDFFAYPYGVCDARAVEAVARAGYAGAVTCEGGVLPPWAEQNRYRLPRIMGDQLSRVSDFALRFNPAYRRLRRLRAWVQDRRGESNGNGAKKE